MAASGGPSAYGLSTAYTANSIGVGMPCRSPSRTGPAQRTYQPRHAEASVLHVVLREHLMIFCAPRPTGPIQRCGGGLNGNVHLHTLALLFDPLEFMETLAAIIPRPSVNLVSMMRDASLSVRT